MVRLAAGTDELVAVRPAGKYLSIVILAVLLLSRDNSASFQAVPVWLVPIPEQHTSAALQSAIFGLKLELSKGSKQRCKNEVPLGCESPSESKSYCQDNWRGG